METWNDSQRTDVFTLNEDPVSANMNNSSDVPSLNTNDEVVDMGADFDFEGFQVVRREFFAHLREPAVTFNNYKFYVNCACLNSKSGNQNHGITPLCRKHKRQLRVVRNVEREAFSAANNL